jgi:predicted TIM-barrel fold metal-dependent hydrolase
MIPRMSVVVFAVTTTLLLASQPPAQPAVDHHQHLFSPEISKLSGLRTLSAVDLVGLLDLAGIRRAIVFSLGYQYGNPNRAPIENEYERVKAENDWTSRQIAAFPDRLRGFCGLNPLKDYALAEIARCGKDPSLRFGLKMHFGNSDVDLLNAAHIEQLRRVFRAANDQGMAIVVHMRSSVTRARPYGAKQATVFLKELIPSAPDVPIQIAHLAGAGGYEGPLVDEALAVFVEAVARKDPAMARVYFDVSGITLGEWADRAELIAMRIRALGVGRILYGSDGAAGGNLAPREAWAMFRQLPLTEAEFMTIAANVA